VKRFRAKFAAIASNAELWVVDRLTNKTVVRRVATGGDTERPSPEVLALKAVELLRASLLELMVERNAAPPPRASRIATQHASDWAARPLISAAPRWAIETGAAVIWSPTQIDAAFESVARGRFAPAKDLQIKLSFVGLGTHRQVSGTGGSAFLEQWCGLAEGLFFPLPPFVIRPYLVLGGCDAPCPGCACLARGAERLLTGSAAGRRAPAEHARTR
jgi:hypothetical protein